VSGAPSNGLAAMLQAGHSLRSKGMRPRYEGAMPVSCSRAVCPPKVGALARPALTDGHFSDENQGLSASAACWAAIRLPDHAVWVGSDRTRVGAL
jgi:hypothetical protein